MFKKLNQLINETMDEMGALQQKFSLGSSQTPVNNINNPVPAPGAITNGKILLPIQNEENEETESILYYLDANKIDNIYGILKNIFLNNTIDKREKLIEISKLIDDVKKNQ